MIRRYLSFECQTFEPCHEPAVTVFNPAGQHIHAAASVSASASRLHKKLNPVENCRLNDCLVISLDILLRDLALVGLYLLGKKIHGYVFLEQSIALVFFI